MGKWQEVVYDIEVMPNLFLATFFEPNIGVVKTFEISPRHNHFYAMQDYLEGLRKAEALMVGYNNYSYDYPVLHAMWGLSEDKLAAATAWKKSCEIIDAGQDERFAHIIWDRDMRVHQLDLYKLHHFDNRMKHVSLKRLEFNMRRKSIVEYEAGFDHMVTDSAEIDALIAYNVEDVMATYQFRRMSEEAIAFRETLIDEFGIEVFNYNDTKIGEKLVQKKLEERFGQGALYDFEEDEYGGFKRRPKQTPRQYVDAKDIVFSIYKFKNPDFKKVYEFIRGLRIYVLGARYEWSDQPDYLQGKRRVEEAKRELKLLGRKSEEYKEKKTELAKLAEKYRDYDISVDHDGVTFELGKGGIHAARPWGVFRKRPGYKIMDMDVASFYPSIAIEYKMRPAHLPDEFTEIYGGLKKERMAYKKTNPSRAKMLKLALNGTYGKTNSVYSMLYDPEYSLKTVINGQLMLLMLWDQLGASLSTVELIQANTDGLTYMVSEDEEEAAQEICRAWEDMTRMNLEFTEYESMFIRDVNNYVARSVTGRVKAKGAYNWMELYTGSASGVTWNKNHSAVIVPMAAVHALVNDDEVDEYIRDHEDIFDFFLCTNVNRSSRLLWGDEEVQRNSRYIISTTGKELTKVMPPLARTPDKERHIGVNKGELVTIYNTVESNYADDYDINYDWYIKEAQKLVEGFRK